MSISFLSSYRMAAQRMLRRRSCEKRAEQILCRIGGDGWVVSIAPDKIQAIQRKTQGTDMFSWQESWLRFEIQSSGIASLVSGQQTVSLVSSLEFTHIALSNEHHQEENLSDTSGSRRRIVSALRRIYAVAGAPSPAPCN